VNIDNSESFRDVFQRKLDAANAREQRRKVDVENALNHIVAVKYRC